MSLVYPVQESRSDSSVVLKDLEGSATITHADPGLYTTRYVEVVGLVREDLTIMQQVVTPFGDEFDMETYAKAVGLWHSAKFSSLFV